MNIHQFLIRRLGADVAGIIFAYLRHNLDIMQHIKAATGGLHNLKWLSLKEQSKFLYYARNSNLPDGCLEPNSWSVARRLTTKIFYRKNIYINKDTKSLIWPILAAQIKRDDLLFHHNNNTPDVLSDGDCEICD